MSTSSQQTSRFPNRGAFGSDDEALGELVRRLARTLDPVEIWLFGSRAMGSHAVDSDFDLLVVTKDEDGALASDYDRAYAPVKGLGIGCDIIPVKESEFKNEPSDATSLCNRVVNTGLRLYERKTRRILSPAR